MALQDLSLETIEDFLAQKRIALIGVSRKPGSFSIPTFQELTRRGYDVVPVNPNLPEFQGRRCFARVQDIQPPVQAALLITSPEVTDTVVRDCAEAGIPRVWMHRGAGKAPSVPRLSSSAASEAFASSPVSARSCFCRRAAPSIASTASSANSPAATPSTPTRSPAKRPPRPSLLYGTIHFS
ncbi:MAG TPA: CoA-binding protein [Candidatus Bathyarchaeia archaeon]|nr:CoA-binding protein [Candidatus Bathyarchaeia archaeon]